MELSESGGLFLPKPFCAAQSGDEPGWDSHRRAVPRCDGSPRPSGPLEVLAFKNT